MSDAWKTVLVVLGVVGAVFVLLPTLWGGAMMGGFGPGMMGGYGPGMMGGYGWGQGWGWGGTAGVISTIIFWILIIGGVVLLVKWLASSARTGDSPFRTGESALDILKRRYASGEITKAEFEQTKQDLT
ncbi:MAG: SHOCT domain-containing protein [Chloroflexi bacterium]|nr:SHOCT domain-containing protein [Chloroflexota bacterium]